MNCGCEGRKEILSETANPLFLMGGMILAFLLMGAMFIRSI